MQMSFFESCMHFPRVASGEPQPLRNDTRRDRGNNYAHSLSILFAGAIETAYVQRGGLRDRPETMGKTAIRQRSGLAGHPAVDNQFQFRLRFRKRRDDLETIHVGQRATEQAQGRPQAGLSKVRTHQSNFASTDPAATSTVAFHLNQAPRSHRKRCEIGTKLDCPTLHISDSHLRSWKYERVPRLTSVFLIV